MSTPLGLDQGLWPPRCGKMLQIQKRETSETNEATDVAAHDPACFGTGPQAVHGPFVILGVWLSWQREPQSWRYVPPVSPPANSAIQYVDGQVVV